MIIPPKGGDNMDDLLYRWLLVYLYHFATNLKNYAQRLQVAIRRALLDYAIYIQIELLRLGNARNYLFFDSSDITEKLPDCLFNFCQTLEKGIVKISLSHPFPEVFNAIAIA